MANDVELDRLKAAQERAFQNKQKAYEAQQSAWNRRSRTREVMNRAYDAKQSAYAEQDAAWQELDRVRSRNGPRIDSLNAQQEVAYQNMGRAFSNSRSAWDRGDRANAATYSAEGKNYKAESQRYVAERRQLVAEIRSASARHAATRPAFQRAKSEYDRAKRDFDAAKAQHESAQAAFQRAKAEFESAAQAYQTRLQRVKAENRKHKDDKAAVAARAGVPYRYRDNVWISKQPDGTVNIYFGGVGEPNGPGHGHYVMDRSGEVTYKRDPFDPHGAHNFTDDRGSTFYERGRSNKSPVHAEGYLPLRSSEPGVDIDVAHVTQVYDDGYRLSRNVDGTSESKRHWTRQDVRKKDPRRHIPPADAR